MDVDIFIPCTIDQFYPEIGFNMVNNQISDILIDEIGTVLTFDQNTLPQNSDTN